MTVHRPSVRPHHRETKCLISHFLASLGLVWEPRCNLIFHMHVVILLWSGGSDKLVSAAVRCLWPSWRHSKVKLSTSRIFENVGVVVSYVNTLSLNEAPMWCLFWSRILFTSHSNGRGRCVLITTWKFRKKGFWSILVSIQGRKIMCTRCGISLDKNSFFAGSKAWENL